MEGISVTYKGVGQVSKCTEDNGSQLSHCWEREFWVWRGSELERPPWCWIGPRDDVS